MKLSHGRIQAYSVLNFLFLYFSLEVQPVLQFPILFRLPQYRPLLRRVNHPTEDSELNVIFRMRRLLLARKESVN